MKKHVESQKIKTITSKKSAIKITLLLSAICLTGVALSILIPITLRMNHPTSELKDVNMDSLSFISGLPGSFEQCPTATPSLDEVWESFLSYSGNQESPFVCETDLVSSSNYNCYYLSKKTITKIDNYSSKENLYYMFNENGSINYLRYFKKLFDESKLDDSDKVVQITTKIGTSFVDREIDNYVLVKITRSIDISNKSLGNEFVENINYQDNGTNIKPLDGPFSERYNNQKVIINNLPYLKSLFKEGVFYANYLDTFSYLVDTRNNMFETFIKYNCSILESDVHYYDSIDSIIVEKTFITKAKYFDSDNVEQTFDCYQVKCDYSKAKALLRF